MVALPIQQSGGRAVVPKLVREKGCDGVGRPVPSGAPPLKEARHETRCTACAPHAQCGVPHGGGIRGQDTHPCGAGKMACSAGAMRDAVQVMCAPTLTSRVMVV